MVSQKRRGRFPNLPLPYTCSACFASFVIYAFPASFNALNTFSGLSGNVLIRTPVAL